jgi:hypothetical protein
VPGIIGINPPAPLPGSAPSGYGSPGYVGGPVVETLPDGTVVRRYTEEQMNGYFDGRVADEYHIPDGCDGLEERVWYGYFSVDALYWDRVRSDSGNFANFLGGGGRALGGQDFLWNDLEIMQRVSAGIVNDHGWGFDAVVYWDDDLDTHSSVTTGFDLSMNAFGTPSAVFMENFFLADAVIGTRNTRLHSGEVFFAQHDAFLNLLLGVRYIELDDYLGIQVENSAFDDAFVSILTKNRLYGAQIGVRANQKSGVYGYEFYLKLGYYLNIADSETTIINAGAGLPDQVRTFDDGRADCFVGDGQFAFYYDPYIWWRLKLGWNGLIMMQLAMANDQILNNDETGTLMHQHGDLIFHGPFASSEIRW